MTNSFDEIIGQSIQSIIYDYGGDGNKGSLIFTTNDDSKYATYIEHDYGCASVLINKHYDDAINIDNMFCSMKLSDSMCIPLSLYERGDTRCQETIELLRSMHKDWYDIASKDKRNYVTVSKIHLHFADYRHDSDNEFVDDLTYYMITISDGLCWPELTLVEHN